MTAKSHANPEKPPLAAGIHRLRLPLATDAAAGWKPLPFFWGSTGNLTSLSCHASALLPRHSPHAPHHHDDEELLLLLAGEVDLLLPQGPDGGPRVRLKAGQFVYYPARFAHSLEAVGETAANYLMFRWHGGAARAGVALPHARYEMSAHEPGGAAGFRTRLVFEGETRWLRKLHCHTSRLEPGAGYEAHVDEHDVAIVVLDGEVETLGERAGPFDVVLYPAGEAHGMRNPGSRPAAYVVFEFHGEAMTPRTPGGWRQLLNRMWPIAARG